VVNLPPVTRVMVSGSVSGYGCGGDFETAIALYMD